MNLGCFSWLFLVALCSWPVHELGASDGWALGLGLVLASLVTGAVALWHERPEA
jgi:hypothetical protein